MKQLNRIKARLQTVAAESFRRISFPWLFLPVVVAIAGFLVISNRMPEDYSDWWCAHKQVLEFWALILTGGAFAVSLLRIFVTKREIFSCWLSGLVLILWFREIHWDWMSNGVYVGLFFWAVFGCWKYELLKSRLQDRKTITLLALIFFSYAVAVTFDQQWWTETKFMDKAGKLAGEILENMGHCCLVLLVLVSPWKKKGLSVPESA